MENIGLTKSIAWLLLSFIYLKGRGPEGSKEISPQVHSPTCLQKLVLCQTQTRSLHLHLLSYTGGRSSSTPDCLSDFAGYVSREIDEQWSRRNSEALRDRMLVLSVASPSVPQGWLMNVLGGTLSDKVPSFCRQEEVCGWGLFCRGSDK